MTRPSEKSFGIAAALVLAAPVVVGTGYATAAALGLAGAGATGQASLDRAVAVLTDPVVWGGTLWILWVAAASTVLSAAIAIAIAVTFRGAGRLDALGRTLAVLPLPVPHLVAAVGGLLVLGQSGLIARVAFHLGFIDGPAAMPALVYDPAGIGLVLALTWKEVPFLTLVAVSVLATRGDALERTARGLGAGRRDVFWRVTWPVLWRGLMPAAVAVFTFVAGSYEAAVILAPSDPLALPVLTWERFVDAGLGQRADAYVLALLGFGIALAAVAVHEWVRARIGLLDGGSA
ncbi:MAG: ABC transporter permease subunit [Gemmatimonadota bacterium]